MQSGGNELKELRIIACFMAELPVVEEVSLPPLSLEGNAPRLTSGDHLCPLQGFEGNRRSSRDWTWSNKVQEVSWLLEGIRQVGFAWGIGSFALEEVIKVRNYSPSIAARHSSLC